MTQYKCCKQLFDPEAFADHLENVHGFKDGVQWRFTTRLMSSIKTNGQMIVRHEHTAIDRGFKFTQIDTLVVEPEEA